MLKCLTRNVLLGFILIALITPTLSAQTTAPPPGTTASDPVSGTDPEPTQPSFFSSMLSFLYFGIQYSGY